MTFLEFITEPMSADKKKEKKLPGMWRESHL
jgi:hypothetical protein